MTRRLLSISLALFLASTLLGQGTGAVPTAIGGGNPIAAEDPSSTTTLTVTTVISIYVPEATRPPATVDTSLPSSSSSSSSGNDRAMEARYPSVIGSYPGNQNPDVAAVLRNGDSGTGQLPPGSPVLVYAGTPLDFSNSQQQQRPKPSQTIQALPPPRPSPVPVQRVSLPVQQVQIPIPQQQQVYPFSLVNGGDNWVVPGPVPVPAVAPQSVNYQPAETSTHTQAKPKQNSIVAPRPTSTPKAITTPSPQEAEGSRSASQSGNPVSSVPSPLVSIQEPETGPPSSNPPHLSAPPNTILCYKDPSSSDTLYCTDGRVYKSGSASSPAQQGSGVFSSVHVAPDSPPLTTSMAKSNKKKRSSSPMYGSDAHTGHHMNPTEPQAHPWYPSSSSSSSSASSSSRKYKRGATEESQDWGSIPPSWPLYGLEPMSSEDSLQASTGGEPYGIEQASDEISDSSKYGNGGGSHSGSSYGGGGGGSHGSDWYSGSGSGSNYGGSGGYRKHGSYKSKRQLVPIGNGAGAPDDQDNTITVPINIGLAWDGTNVIPVPAGSPSSFPSGRKGGPGAIGGPGGPGGSGQVIPVPINVDTLVYPNGQMVVVPPGNDG